MNEPILDRSVVAAAATQPDAVAWDRGAIVFSACNEDSQSELRAFGSLEGQRVMCVTAGGGRVLNLLASRPREILAVDLNPAQNALLELKIAGLRALDHARYLEFLGARPAHDRLATYERLRGGLSPGARAFFDRNPSLVRDGVLMQGKLERFLGRLAKLLRFGHPLGLDRLFGFEHIAEQREFMARWDNLLWRGVVRNVARRWVMQVFSGDPGFYRYVPEHIPLHHVIYDRVHQYFWNHLARENPLLQIVFYGRYVYEPALPIYLNAASYAEVQAALAHVRIETATATVADALAHAAPESFDAFSLSDISSYLDDQAHAELFERVLAAARPGAKLCSRSNIHHRALSPAHAQRITRNPELERKLAIDDHSCVHEFLVGEITR